MKQVVVMTLCFTASVFAVNSGFIEMGSAVNPEPLSNDISIAVVNIVDIPNMLAGIDIYEDGVNVELIAPDNTSDIIWFYNASNGYTTGSLIPDSTHTGLYGVAWNNDVDGDTYLLNDLNSDSFYYTEDFGSSWINYSDPSGNQGRGMDYDGSDYWTPNGMYHDVFRFQPGGSVYSYSTPEIPEYSQLSGIAVFPCNGDIGVVLTTYTEHELFFYQFDGSTLSYLGSAPCPEDCWMSYGLAYSETTGHLYWSYFDAGGCHFAELSFIISGTALSQDSWGSIKSCF